MLGIMLLNTGCAEITGTKQTAFRVRTDLTADLNENNGWGGTVNERVMVNADQPFRIRFEVEGAEGQPLGLEYKRNDGSWIRVEVSDFPYPDSISPGVSIVSSDAYTQGAPTENLIDASPLPFFAGQGISLSAQTSADAAPAGSQSEWEWPLVIRRFADGAITNEQGDEFSFRMVRLDGVPVESTSVPVVELEIPGGHLGGTFVETPGRIGPWEASNGDLYFIMEPSETDNVLMMVKSSDGGSSWTEVDGANRPIADDLEGVASAYTPGVIHILHQQSRNVWYHAFHTSDNPYSQDAWGITDEDVAAHPKPPTQVAALAARSDGSLVGVYGSRPKIHIRIRSAAGSWGEEIVLDQDNNLVLSGPQVITGTDDVVHLAYTANDGSAWYRTIQPDGTLSDRMLLTSGIGTTDYDVGSILPLVFIPETNTVVVIYRQDTGMLWERRISGAGSMSIPVQLSDRKVIQNAIDSDQTGADAVAFREHVYVLFIEQDTGSIYSVFSDRDANWQLPVQQVSDVQAQWIRGTVLRHNDPEYTYGYVYDAGSNGGSGMNRFNQMLLSE